ncbi:MAG: DUF4443 domain-containing protein [Promethearchaeota archaeon]
METIQKLVTRKGPGHLFRSAHFILALKAIDERGPIGRYELGRILDLGGGSIRTLVNRLKDIKLISVEGKKGHILTDDGHKVLKEIKKTVISIQNLEVAKELTNQKFNFGCQARDISNRIGSGIGLRDAAISIGAKSITSLIYTGDGFIIPTLGKEYLEKEHPQLSSYLLSKYNFQKGDVLIVCGADTLIDAKLGAVTAVFSLLNE